MNLPTCGSSETSVNHVVISEKEFVKHSRLFQLRALLGTYPILISILKGYWKITLEPNATESETLWRDGIAKHRKKPRQTFPTLNGPNVIDFLSLFITVDAPHITVIITVHNSRVLCCIAPFPRE